MERKEIVFIFYWFSQFSEKIKEMRKREVGLGRKLILKARLEYIFLWMGFLKNTCIIFMGIVR